MSNPVPDAMQHHTEVGAGNPQDITDIIGGDLLDLPQDKRQRLPDRCRLKAGEDLSFDLLMTQVRVDRLGWRAPVTAGGEPTLKGLIDRIQLPVPLARRGDPLIEDAEEPRPDAGPSLKTRRGLDKGRERGLRDVLRLLGIGARTARRAEVGILRWRGRCI